MHGVIMVELRNFVSAAYDSNTWDALLKQAGLWPRLYVPVAEYPDSEVVSLVTHASKMTGLGANDLLEKFGEFITAGLFKTYRPLIKDHWRTLDLIENTEQAIHVAIRLKDKRAKPPELRVNRLSPDEVLIHYSSPRKLWPVAKGIAQGVAKHYGETIDVEVTGPMLNGGDHCEIRIRRLDGPAIPTTATERRPAAVTAAEPEPRPRAAQPHPSARRKRKSLWEALFFWRK